MAEGMAASLTLADLLTCFQQLGIAPGAVIEVHSSLKSLGKVEGGADTVITALTQAVGPAGAIVMPAYPLGPALAPTPAESAQGITWKVRKLAFDDRQTRTGMGIIADRFRDWPGVARSTETLFSYCAWGNQAETLAKGVEQLVLVGAHVLLLGVQMDRCSALHLAEQRVTLPEDILRRMDMPDSILREYPEDRWAMGYGPEADFLVVQTEAEARGMISMVTRRRCAIRYFDAGSVVRLYEEMLRADPYRIYGVQHP